ncbi:hypothetical protein TcCL_NonESM01976, partial [Trypanosoma cruzi]
MQMKKQCFSWTAMRTVPRRHQLRLGAEAGASRHTTRRGNRTVSGPHSPPQPGSAAPRQLHCIARPTRIKERYFCPPGSQSSTAAEEHWVPRTHTT